jgi:uncharacterized membrane protein YbaN (DUF454 family)
VYAATATIALIAALSRIISLTNGTSHVCEDALGIETFTAQWAEWLVTVPLLSYVTLAIEDKRSLTKEDKLSIVSVFFMILFGFAMNFVKNSPVYGWTLFSLSGLCYGGLMRMAMTLRKKALAVLREKKTTSTNSWKVERSSMKYRLSALLVVVMPSFPIVYILRYSGALNR